MGLWGPFTCWKSQSVIPHLEIKCNCGWLKHTLCGYVHSVHFPWLPSYSFKAGKTDMPVTALWYQEMINVFAAQPRKLAQYWWPLSLASGAIGTMPSLVQPLRVWLQRTEWCVWDYQWMWCRLPKMQYNLQFHSGFPWLRIINHQLIIETLLRWLLPSSVSVLLTVLTLCSRICVSNLILSCGVWTEVQNP